MIQNNIFLLFIFRGVQILVGDPGRFVLQEHSLKNVLRKISSYDLSSNTILENNGYPSGHVWIFDK